MRIAVWGGGSLGLLWTARLTSLFPKAVLLVRTEKQRDWIRERGISLTHPSGEKEKISAKVRWIGEAGDEPFDCLFIMVKQRDLREVARRLTGFSRLPSLVVLWQNGLGHDEAFDSVLPPGALCGAVTTEGALREGPGEVRHTGEGMTWIGPFSEELAHPGIADKLVGKLKDAGLSVEWENRIVRRIWEKVMVNCAINPLTALLRIPNGGLLHRHDARLLMKSVVEEAVAVARSEGIALEAENMLRKAEEVCRRTSANRSSMLQDVERGRMTEIDWINGEVVRRGLRAGIETPVNQTLVRLVHLLEMRDSDSDSSDGARRHWRPSPRVRGGARR